MLRFRYQVICLLRGDVVLLPLVVDGLWLVQPNAYEDLQLKSREIIVRQMFIQFPEIRKQLWGGDFWSDEDRNG